MEPHPVNSGASSNQINKRHDTQCHISKRNAIWLDYSVLLQLVSTTAQIQQLHQWPYASSYDSRIGSRSGTKAASLGLGKKHHPLGKFKFVSSVASLKIKKKKLRQLDCTQVSNPGFLGKKSFT